MNRHVQSDPLGHDAALYAFARVRAVQRELMVAVLCGALQLE